MFDTPQKNDLDRNLSAILHSSHRAAHEQIKALTFEFSRKGTLQSSAFFASAANIVRRLHEDAMEQSVQFLRDFLERTEVSPLEIVGWAKPHLINMGNTLLGRIPPMGMPSEQQRIVHQYRADFEQRLDGALRDFQIGFIGGRSVAQGNPREESMPEKRPLTTRERGQLFTRALYQKVGPNQSNSASMWDVGESLGWSREDVDAIADYAVQRGWVKYFAIGGSMVITTDGIDLVEEMPAIEEVVPTTQKPTSQNIEIAGSITNSIIQIAGAGSSQNATASVEAIAAVRESLQLINSVIKTINEHTEEIEQLRADIETAEAQLAAPKPRKAVLFQTLKSITENALGSVLGVVLTNMAPNLGALLERALILLR